MAAPNAETASHAALHPAISAVDRDPPANPVLRAVASAPKAPGPPPDGGLHAWTQAVMGHVVVFQTWGVIAGFGVWQTYYVETLGQDASDVSWIGALQVFLIFFIGTLSGRALDAGFFHLAYIAGAAFELLGIFSASFASSYWQLLLSQGLCAGIGHGLMFCPTMGLVSTYFSTHKVFALALAASGGGSGGMVFPAIVRQLLPRVGFGWTMRTTGFVILATATLSASLLRTRLPPRRSGSLIDRSAFREPPYVLFAIGLFFSFWAVFFGFFYIGAYGRDLIGLQYSASVDLLIILNGVGILGRLIPAYLADKYTGALQAIAPFGFVCALLTYAWIAVHSIPGVYAWSVVYGFFGAGIQGLFPPVLASLTEDLQKVGTRMGMVFTLISFATLTGAPLGGALIGQDNGKYLYAQVWAGTSFLVAGCFMVAARVSKVGWVLKAKV